MKFHIHPSMLVASICFMPTHGSSSLSQLEILRQVYISVACYSKPQKDRTVSRIFQDGIDYSIITFHIFSRCPTVFFLLGCYTAMIVMSHVQFNPKVRRFPNRKNSLAIATHPANTFVIQDVHLNNCG